MYKTKKIKKGFKSALRSRPSGNDYRVALPSIGLVLQSLKNRRDNCNMPKSRAINYIRTDGWTDGPSLITENPGY